MGLGVYPDKKIMEFIRDKIIIPKTKIRPKQIQPSSLDLRLGNEAYCMRCSAISTSKISKHIQNNKLYKLSLDKKNGSLFHKGCVYLVELNESLNLPEYIAAKSNPKSSIGRIDSHVRLISENGGIFDEVRENYNGKLFLEIFSRTFDLILREGDSLNQIRFKDSYSNQLSREEIINLDYMNKEGLFKINGDRLDIKKRFLNNSLTLSANLKKNNLVYVARENAPPIDITRKDLPFSEFFNPILLKDSSFIINQNYFYLISTNEFFITPIDYCAEMIDIDTITGEYRTHYAGFFDPGFRGEVVLEIRNIGPPFMIFDGQRIANIVFFPMREIPEKVYGDELKSNYQEQRGIKASKFFDMTK
ncbi:MAG: 2'-deoxycytidine 5'-triphosphate deaminase [Candidatus Pacearchaeota archaeon]